MTGIYKITSPSGKVYIGQSWDIPNRWRQYRNGETKNQRLLNRSFKKHGIKSHKFEVIHQLPIDVTQYILDIYEILYMESYGVAITLLNIKRGGSRGKHSAETRKIMSELATGKTHTEETKQKIRDAKKGVLTSEKAAEMAKLRKGIPLTEQHRRNISEAQKGKPVPMEHIMKMVEARKGKPGPRTGSNCSEETKQKLRDANLGKKHSEETKAKQSAKTKGIPKGPQSEEHKAKVRAAWVRRKQSQLQA